MDREEEWLVEKIRSTNHVKNTDMYLTKWFSWDHSHDVGAQ